MVLHANKVLQEIEKKTRTDRQLGINNWFM